MKLILRDGYWASGTSHEPGPGFCSYDSPYADEETEMWEVPVPGHRAICPEEGFGFFYPIAVWFLITEPCFCLCLCLFFLPRLRSQVAVPGVKNLPTNTRDERDVGWIPGSGRSPGRGHGNPLQYSYLEHPRSPAGYSPWGWKESGTTGAT